MKYYISLPISGKDETKQRELARKVVDKIHKLKHTPVDPFLIGDLLDVRHKKHYLNKPTWKEYMQADLTQLLFCDAIVLCEGWNESLGCELEWQMAKGLGLKIIDEKEL